MPRLKVPETLEVAIPPLVQVPLAAGDRYLAANIEVFRAMMVSAQLRDAATYRVLGQIQAGAAKLNPAHEDNYYISQAILPWNGQVEADLLVQQAATEARPWDPFPPFFLGFDHFYFLHDPVGGARIIQAAAPRAPAGFREPLMAMAARWVEKGEDPRMAIAMIGELAKNTRSRELKQHLEQRQQRMQNLLELRSAADAFAAKNGRPPVRLEELVGPGLLVQLPPDPLGQGYALDDKGLPIIKPAQPAKR